MSIELRPRVPDALHVHAFVVDCAPGESAVAIGVLNALHASAVGGDALVVTAAGAVIVRGAASRAPPPSTLGFRPPSTLGFRPGPPSPL